MTCTHKWHDAPTATGPEWACSKCKVTYSDSKKDPFAKRGWIELTDQQYQEILKKTEGFGLLAFYNMVSAELKKNNHAN
jgi:hypothetical protein